MCACACARARVCVQVINAESDEVPAADMSPEQEEALAAALLGEIGEQCEVLDGLVAEAEAARAAELQYDSEEETDSEADEQESEMLANLATSYDRVEEQLRRLAQKLGTDDNSELREAEQAALLSTGTGADATGGAAGGRPVGLLSGWLPQYCAVM